MNLIPKERNGDGPISRVSRRTLRMERSTVLYWVSQLMYTFCAAYHMGVTSALIDLDARSKAGSGRAMQLSLSKPYGNGPGLST